MACPLTPSPLPNRLPSVGGGQGCQGDPNCPVNLADASVEIGSSYLKTAFGSVDLTWYNLYETEAGVKDNPTRGVGKNWLNSEFAYLEERSAEESVLINFATGRTGKTYWFDSSGGTYSACYGGMSKLVKLPNNDFRLTEPDGVVTIFDGTTKLIKSQSSPGNQVTNYTSSQIGSPPVDRITEVRRDYTEGLAQTTVESRKYDYFTSGPNEGEVQYITLRRATQSTNENWVNIRRVEFVYYDSDVDHGNAGDLKFIKQQLPVGLMQWDDNKIDYFRYYTDDASEGSYKHGLKYWVSPDGYQQAIDDPTLPNDIDNITDGQLKPFSNVYFAYGPESGDRLATTVQTNGGTIDCTILELFIPTSPLTSIQYNDRYRGFSLENGIHGFIKKVYSNQIGQDLLVDDQQSGDQWITYYKHDSSGRVIEEVMPSAIDMSGTPYDVDVPNLAVQIKTLDGLIRKTTYHTAGAIGYPEFEQVQRGSGNPAIKVTETQYEERKIGSGDSEIAVYPVKKQVKYRNDDQNGNDGDPVETNFVYTWHPDTVQVKTVTTELPNVPPEENGVPPFSQDDTIVEEFDLVGRLTRKTDARNTITTYAYDIATNGLTRMTEDVGGLNLVTDYTVDEFGRQTQSLGPEHNLDGQTVRSATWTVYKNEDHELWTGQGYRIGTNDTLVNPVSIRKLDLNGRIIDEIHATRGSGVEDPGKLAESNSFPQPSWVRWIHNVYQYTAQAGGRLAATRIYHTIPTSGDGSETINYDEPSFAYDPIGRENVLTSPGGTITWTVFNHRNQVESVWVGTDDSGATRTEPDSDGRDPANNMKAVTLNEYDDGVQGGDGNLTKTTKPVDDNSDRISQMQYDWRDRLVVTITDDGTYVFHAINTLDNLGRTTVVETKRDDTTNLILVGKNETKFDERGRVFRTLRFAVSDTGTVGNPLQENFWFDANNNVIKSKPSGAQSFTKTTYDAINRPIATYFGYNETGSDDPTTLTGDVIFEESQTVYDDASNITFETKKQRFHNAVGTGALNGPSGSQPKSRDVYEATWLDGIGRTIATANYGTNDGTVPMRPDTPPSSSDTVLVSQNVYNADGEQEDTIDASGKADRTEYDDAGRVTKVTQNYGSTPTEVVSTEYNPDSQVSKLIAENSDTNDQVTEYTYGVTLSNSKIASNMLLRKTTYPDNGEVLYEYNRQGDQSKMTDQNGSVHEYEFDKLGRLTEDRVTEGSGVDSSVLRIETIFDSRRRRQNITSWSAATGGSVTSDIQFEYDGFNQVTKEYQQHGAPVNTGSSPSVHYAYNDGTDNNTRPTSLTYPDSRTINFDYGIADSDDDNLSRIGKLKIESTEIVDYRYLGEDQVVIQKYTEPSTHVEFTLAFGASNDPYDGLDRFGRIVDLRWQQGSTKLVHLEYGYDRVGNRLYAKDNVAKTNSQKFDELYKYDVLHRLEKYDRGELNLDNSAITTPTLTQDWNLDQTGNWKGFQQGVVGVLDQTRGHNEVNEITNITRIVGEDWPTPMYDNNGNTEIFPQPNDLEASFDATWDAWNRLVRLKDGQDTVAEFEYDGLARRTIKKIYDSGDPSETRHSYYSMASQVLEERVDASNNAFQQFLWGVRFVDDLVLREKDTNANGQLDERLYAANDPRYSILAITDTTGAVKERYAYEAYGRSKVLTPSFVDRPSSDYDWEFRYTGRRLDLETAIHYFRARYYHSELGRFISRDLGEIVDGLNLYRAYFVPNGMDPYGLLQVKGKGGTDVSIYKCVYVNTTDWVEKQEKLIAVKKGTDPRPCCLKETPSGFLFLRAVFVKNTVDPGKKPILIPPTPVVGNDPEPIGGGGTDHPPFLPEEPGDDYKLFAVTCFGKCAELNKKCGKSFCHECCDWCFNKMLKLCRKESGRHAIACHHLARALYLTCYLSCDAKPADDPPAPQPPVIICDK